MTVTLPNGTSVSGSPEELQKLGYLPPPPQFNWDGSPKITCKTSGTDNLAGMTASEIEFVSGMKGAPV